MKFHGINIYPYTDYEYNPDWVKDRLDIIPEYSDCPQEGKAK